VVRVGTDLQAALRAAPRGGALLLEPGIHAGPLRLDRPVIIWGPSEAVIRSPGQGTTIEVRADSVSLLGFTVEGSGRRFEMTDAAVSVRGNDTRVEGLRIRRALFGVTVEGARRAMILGNVIFGDSPSALGLRGDAIRFWEVRDSLIAGNLVTDSRDIVVWYSPRNAVTSNFVEAGRYGTHFMYSHGNTVSGNTYIGNVVGVFVMYSDSVAVRGNRLAYCGPTGGMGLGVKESGELTVTDNLLLGNQDGIYLDTSPLQRTHRNVFEHNSFMFCDAGVAFHRSGERSRFVGNDFRGCTTAARMDGGGDALSSEWSDNHFDDYQGYDLDCDGRGDVPYELSRLSGQVTATREDLRFFRGTPALALLDAVGRIVPLLAPRIVLRDLHPRMRAAAVLPTAPGDGEGVRHAD